MNRKLSYTYSKIARYTSALMIRYLIIRAAFLLDILAGAKIFSLCTQKADTNIIEITDAAQNTQCHYNNRLKKSSIKVLRLFLSYQPLASVLCWAWNWKNNGEKTYQDQKLNNFTQAKDYIQTHASDIVSKIIPCFDDYFVNIYYEYSKTSCIVKWRTIRRK